MKRNSYKFQQLMEQNKEELQNNQKAIERIEKKLESKFISVNNK